MELKKQKTKNNNLKIRDWFKFWIIPFALVIFWLGLSLLNVNTNSGLTVLIHQHGLNETTSWKTDELLAGEKSSGEFLARDNNLGIVAVRFNTFFRINDDLIKFKIREKGSKNWYYENDYTTPQFQPNQLFTFGFPIINDSANKTYQFEMESVKGEKENAVALSVIEPTFVTKYQYSKTLIKTNKKYAINFLYKKTINSITNPNFLLASIAYSLPLIIYLIWILLFEKYLYNKYYLTIIPIVLMIFFSILNLPNNDALVLGLTGLWIAVSYAYGLKTTVSYYLALFSLIVSPILGYLSFSEVSKNFSMWALMLLLVGIVIQIGEFRWERKNQQDAEIFRLTPKRK